MSLRARLVALVGAILLLSLGLGLLVSGLQARKALAEELGAALGGGRQTVLSAFEDLPRSDHAARDLRQTVNTFDGNRHVQAILVDSRGRVAWASRTRWPSRPAPWWFARLFGRTPPAVAVPLPASVPGYRQITLVPIAEPDLAAAWRGFVGIAAVLGSGALAGMALVTLLITAAFRPLTSLAGQFGRVAAGDYGGRVDERGPPELRRLQRGFNHMAAELAATTERNRLLNAQIADLQEEERAEIARDLHDEIGPHLFAVNLDAEMIVQLCEAGRHDAVRAQARAIQTGVGHMQREVRDLLGRLRPTRVTEFGLAAAIGDLVQFWSARRPEIAFHVELPQDGRPLPESIAEIVHRVAQEGVNNAIRHGAPSSVAIAIAVADDELTVSVVDDGPAAGTAGTGGFGLIGMRERVTAAGGSLSYGPRPEGRGWVTAARLRLASGAPTRPLAQAAS